MSIPLIISDKKGELSLSIEPLLLHEEPAPYEEPVKQETNDGRCAFRKNVGSRGGRHAKAAFLFMRVIAVLLLFIVLSHFCVRFLLPLFLGLSSNFAHSESHVLETPDTLELHIHELFDREVPGILHEFEMFEQRFVRVWQSQEHRWEHYNIFKQNLREIERLNAEAKAQRRNVTYGVNDMADWTEEDMKMMLLPLDHFQKRRRDAKFIRKMNPILRRAFTARSTEQEGNEFPRHFDWRDRGVVTPVKAQGKCGSCWAFAAVATTESANAVAHGALRNLSEQELLDCNLENNACNGGNEDKAFSFIHEFGLVGEHEYPYVAHRQNVCRVDEQMNLTKIDVAVFINPDEQSMLDWLLNFGPVNVGIAVPPDMKPYTGGIYHPSDYDCKFRIMGLHALLVVGYGVSEEGEKYWIVKNSWGNTWGQEHGYLNFIRGINACGIEDDPIGLLA